MLYFDYGDSAILKGKTMNESKKEIINAELAAIKTLLAAGYDVRLFKRIDSVHTEERNYQLPENK